MPAFLSGGRSLPGLLKSAAGVVEDSAEFAGGDVVLLANFLAHKLVIEKVEQNFAVTAAQSSQCVFGGFRIFDLR